MSITLATWNTEWATPSSDRGPRIATILENVDADVLVVTEGVRELLPAGGSVVDAGGDWGYGLKPSRRKVLIWSRFPLTCDMIGEGGATRGRLVVATVHVPSGPVRIIGVCIPWRDAHVTTGRRDAQPWSEHLDYLNQLEDLLARLDNEIPTVVAGDFNQRIPRERQPMLVANRLGEVLAGWEIHSAGSFPNGPHIDHIASNRHLILESAHDWPASDQRGRLSDHAGVCCRLRYTDESELKASQNSRSGLGPVENCPGAAPIPHRDLIPELAPTAVDSALPSDLRSEIEDVLRRSGDGLSHGATFRLREQGLIDEQIAAARGVSLSTTRGFLRSLEALLSGALPENKSAALRNSYVYREMLNHPRSDVLDRYVKAQLRKLHEINPEVTFAPLQTRSHQYRVGSREKTTTVEDPCPDCAAVGIVHSGRC